MEEERKTFIINDDLEDKADENSHFEDVVDLYNAPNVVEMLLVGHLNTLKKNDTLQFVDYGK